MSVFWISGNPKSSWLAISRKDEQSGQKSNLPKSSTSRWILLRLLRSQLRNSTSDDRADENGPENSIRTQYLYGEG